MIDFTDIDTWHGIDDVWTLKDEYVCDPERNIIAKARKFSSAYIQDGFPHIVPIRLVESDENECEKLKSICSVTELLDTGGKQER